MMWNLCAWVGIVVLAVLALKAVYFAAESVAVACIGWTRWNRFRRESWACATFSDLPEDPDF